MKSSLISSSSTQIRPVKDGLQEQHFSDNNTVNATEKSELQTWQEGLKNCYIQWYYCALCFCCSFQENRLEILFLEHIFYIQILV